MNEMLSIVVPVYNGSSFIAHAIESIYGQQELPKDFEILLIDDGSQDDSYDICLELAQAHPEICVLRNPVNRGIAASRNLGVMNASGQFLAMLDQDDAWRPDKLVKQYKALIDNPDADLVLGMQEFHLSGTDQFPPWFKPEWADAPQAGYVFGCILIRKSIFLNVGLLDETLRYGSDDVDWFGRAKSMGLNEIVIADVVLDRRIHLSNTSSQTKSFNAELLKVIRRKIGKS